MTTSPPPGGTGPDRTASDGTASGGTGSHGTAPGGAGPDGTAPGDGHYGEDLFAPEHPREAERIDAAALVYDPVTTRRLRALGVGPGSRCLDVGAGTGTVARWLLEEADVDEVVALDRDTSQLGSLTDPRLRVITGDLTDEDLNPGHFDLIHARFVLMHLPQRRRLITRLAGWLDPGGRLVLADALEVPDALDTSSAYRRTMDAMWRALRSTIGTDITTVPAYPHFLREEGLHDVAAELCVPPLVAGDPLALFWSETWSRMRPALEETGLVDAAVVDEALAYLASPRLAELGPGMLLAWGRRD
ncbi:methyltransferase domain-containing protein [Streptomyces sp. 5-8]|uniref:Methyltransferase domain-containing protein n=1 Tax=Streptomyces musisoli TaxID=2802280 RepID=A0ABS1NW20_9ACTN|nr:MULTISPECIES: class I SAM-dependent methyltransferase [Streptomyces]MBL1104307.1 methyltransferase domain-containing protein [Streptomyces musisoli]MBY8844463.1 methyltransferase domain-containing protein [Streptomyces sp. SP2-10]